MNEVSSSFLRRLATILSLRFHLFHRRLASRGVGTQVLTYLFGLAGGGLLVVLGGVSATAAATTDPRLALSVLGVGLALAHLFLLLDVVARVGRGEGMAAALYQYPLSPPLIHASEVITGGVSPLLLGVAAGLVPAVTVLAAYPVLGFLSGLLCVAYLMGLRQLLQLVLSGLLRRRWLREVALALVSTVGLVFWLGMVWFDEALRRVDLLLWLASLPDFFWMLPFHWFGLPFAAVGELPDAARWLGAAGAPLLTLAVFVVGFELQEAASFGEGQTLLPRRRRKKTGRGAVWHLAERWPVRMVPPLVWATGAKELLLVRRDPFLMVMLGSQAAMFFAVPYLLLDGKIGTGVALGSAPMAFFVLMLLVAEHPPLFNVLGTEGRALRFLAQTPASRFQILMGKNLAYGAAFAALNSLAICGTSWAVGGEALPMELVVLGLSGLAVVLGLGNLVSVFVPFPSVGARAAAGGARSAAAAADGGVERPGCGMLMLRMVFVNVLMLLFLPLGGLVLVSILLGSAALWAGLASLAYGLILYVVTTWLAAARLSSAEESLLTRMTTKGAA